MVTLYLPKLLFCFLHICFTEIKQIFPIPIIFNQIDFSKRTARAATLTLTFLLVVGLAIALVNKYVFKHIYMKVLVLYTST